ncbi:ImmA/IrrE family metallo-endopeptidase [Flexivirga oryzae]|uniref:Zn-dependent peptidase ImmA (M78 family) n=1 Tax=Flexivirga oryzae TaxID=1794944 RepID=A0A839N2C0_9MICO|nr:ImmA/IrrE family metallo-endopeptidase [Flexivirga oryzae]MBB2890939.1 Zn-dependent peptidase ImmA (M78 family) [Flexivirga oryzae]
MQNAPTRTPLTTMQPSVLKRLRSLTPTRPCTFAEALRIAELQAARLRELIAATDDESFPVESISELPRIRIERRPLPTSGVSYWDRDNSGWVIGINSGESEARQRFSLIHEYKHIIDHGSTSYLYTGSRFTSADRQAEQVADYFAGCVLMPKRLMLRAWGNRVQSPEDLSWLFDVSIRAISVRLAQLGLTEPTPRCALPRTRPIRSANYQKAPTR